MTVRIKETVRNAQLQKVLDAIDAGSGPGTIEIRTGSQPATADTAASGTLLVTFTLADPSCATPTLGVLTFNLAPDISGVAVAAGTAGWGRVKDSDGNTVFDGSVGTSGTDFIITSTTIANGQTVTLTDGTLTNPV